jgi:hypothetical protein
VLRWTCLEDGCDAVVEAPDEEQLIERVNAHVGEAHASYELDEVIVANAELVRDDDA